MLTGRSPMVSQTPEDIARETLDREIPYPARYWAAHSADAKAFVKGFLTKDPTKRMTVEAALEHPWLNPGAMAAAPTSEAISVSAPATTEHEDRSAPLQQRRTLKSTRANPIVGDMTGGQAPAHTDQVDTLDLIKGRASEHYSRLQNVDSDRTL
jgi:serine/threonine protein kinase